MLESSSSLIALIVSFAKFGNVEDFIDLEIPLPAKISDILPMEVTFLPLALAISSKVCS